MCVFEPCPSEFVCVPRDRRDDEGLIVCVSELVSERASACAHACAHSPPQHI